MRNFLIRLFGLNVITSETLALQYSAELIDTLKQELAKSQEERLRLQELVYKRFGLVTPEQTESPQVRVQPNSLNWPQTRRNLEKRDLDAAIAAKKEVDAKENEWKGYQKEIKTGVVIEGEKNAS